MTDNRTNEQTAEQVVEEALNRIDLYADEMPKAVVSALRARNLLSEGAPSEEQIERALDALSRFNQWTDNPRGAMRAALTAAGVAPQGSKQNETKSGQDFVSLDPKKVAEVLLDLMRAEAMLFDNGTEEWIAESDPVECLPPLASAFCEAYTEGKLT